MVASSTSLTSKSEIRLNYLEDLVKSKTLKFNPKKKGSEKIPIEAGYSLDFNKGVVEYDESIKDHWIDIITDVLSKKPDCYTFSKYYADILINTIYRKITSSSKNELFISGPPRGGLSYEMAVSMSIYRRYSEFYSGLIPQPIHAIDKKIFRKFNKQKADAKRNIIICDDAIITGNAMREEIKKIQEDKFYKKYEITPAGILIGVDCDLFGKSGKLVSLELEEEFGIPVESIVHMREGMDRFNCPKYEEEFTKSFTKDVYEPFNKFMRTQRKHYNKPLYEIPKLMKD